MITIRIVKTTQCTLFCELYWTFPIQYRARREYSTHFSTALKCTRAFARLDDEYIKCARIALSACLKHCTPFDIYTHTFCEFVVERSVCVCVPRACGSRIFTRRASSPQIVRYEYKRSASVVMPLFGWAVFVGFWLCVWVAFAHFSTCPSIVVADVCVACLGFILCWSGTTLAAATCTKDARKSRPFVISALECDCAIVSKLVIIWHSNECTWRRA